MTQPSYQPPYSPPQQQPSPYSQPPMARPPASAGASPIGLPPGAPRELRSPAGSFIAILPPDEQRSFRGPVGFWQYTLSLFSFGSLGLLIALRVFMRGMDPSDPAFLIVGLLWVATIIPAVAIMFLDKKLMRMFIVPRVALRRGKLFDPRQGSMLAAVEDARTFHKTKLLPDEAGLICVRPGALDLEFGRMRARLVAADLRLEMFQPKKSVVLKVVANIGGYPFEITLDEMEGMAFKRSFEKSSDRASRLFYFIQRNIGAPAMPGYGAPPQAPMYGAPAQPHYGAPAQQPQYGVPSQFGAPQPQAQPQPRPYAPPQPQSRPAAAPPQASMYGMPPQQPQYGVPSQFGAPPQRPVPTPAQPGYTPPAQMPPPAEDEFQAPQF